MNGCLGSSGQSPMIRNLPEVVLMSVPFEQPRNWPVDGKVCSYKGCLKKLAAYTTNSVCAAYESLYVCMYVGM